jgi:hypothetical protein
MRLVVICALAAALPAAASADALPFTHKVEVYRNKPGDVRAFSLRLEQAFLAEEFEKSNYLRLEALDKNAYLIYPTETKFNQKHAAFHGRLRGEGKAKLRLSYEIVSENPDGSRKVEVRSTDIEVSIPEQEVGPESIYQAWARQQNAHLLDLLQFYPEDSFLEYVLLQSRMRYGVETPRLPGPATTPADAEGLLYSLFSGGVAVQQSLQRQVLTGKPSKGDLNVHISKLQAPDIRSLPYEELLEKSRKAGKGDAHPNDLAKLVPDDHYLLSFRTFEPLGELHDLSASWGDQLLRIFRVSAQDNRLQEKLESQLGLDRAGLTELSKTDVIGDVAITGSDPFFHEGTDIAVLLQLKKPAAFEQAAGAWAARASRQPGVEERTFNYRGQKIVARFSPDRVVSSFVVRLGDVAVYSNSHRAVRRVIDCLTGHAPRLFDALDYRYVTTLLPPDEKDPRSGYFYASEAFQKRIIGPAFKISEKRRSLCYNNLVMLNNASLFYRMEQGKSPASLTELIEGRYIDPDRLVCPHGGAYTIDAERDTCSCSLHNRLRYLTPNAELQVLQVSLQEQQEYDRYKQMYRAFWQGVFDPVAVRFHTGRRVKMEVCVLPFANGGLYEDLRRWVADKPMEIPTAQIVPSAVASFGAVVGRKEVGAFLRQLPGVPEALETDPTLTDLSWLGDRVFFHLCDDDTVLEIDPLKLRPIQGLPLNVGVGDQLTATALVYASVLPSYVTIDVEDRDKAARLLELLSTKVVLKKSNFFGMQTALDAYRLPDYKGHARHVLTYQIHALKVRLHVALVGNRLVAATRPGTLREVIDAAEAKGVEKAPTAHTMLRLNRKGLDRLREPLQLYWEERSRSACHYNIMSVQTLSRLYDAPLEKVNRLADAKYGVTYFCPDGGTYGWNDRGGQVACNVHGNRQQSRQNLGLAPTSSFAKFIESLDEIVTTLRFDGDALIATVEIERSPPKKGDLPSGVKLK